MVDLEAQRQSRHALLNGFDEEGVQRIARSRALVIGAGGLGCPAATYLASSGIGVLHWIDGDTVDATNLARQTLFTAKDIGRPKVVAGKERLSEISPTTRIIDVVAFADRAFLDDAVPQADVVLDCTDQWAVRQDINRACVRHGVPLVSAAAIEWSGQLLGMDPAHKTDACYACVFDPSAAPDDAACGAFGVLAPMVGAMGCLQAAQALIMLLARSAPDGNRPAQKLWLLDMKEGSWQQILVAKNPACPVCGSGA